MDVYGWMVLAALIFLASLISVELGLSAAIIEITLGVVGGNFLGVERHEWVRYIAAFGGILLTFMAGAEVEDRKSTRLNSSHSQISYAVFCLKKKKKECKQSVPPYK